MRCEDGLEKRGFWGEEDGSLVRNERQLDVTGMNTTWHVYPFLTPREQRRNKAVKIRQRHNTFASENSLMRTHLAFSFQAHGFRFSNISASVCHFGS